MKTDKEMYKLFSSYPAYLFECAGIKTKTAYKMKSITLKEFERRSDALLEPIASKFEPFYMAEFQGYDDKTIYHRLVMEMAAFCKENPSKEIKGILVFLNSDLDPKSNPWHYLSGSKQGFLKIVYMDDVLGKLEKKDPNHPLISVFKPFIINGVQSSA